jgi:cyclopropane fatty-acyl-phospholipid synthase-like methyltransferase
VGAGLLTVGDEGFANTPETNHFFVKGQASYIGGMHELLTEMWGSAFKTSETLRTGAPQAKFDFSNASEEEVAAWLRGLHGNAMNEGRMLARKYEMGKYQHLADIAGGSGGIALGAVQECPGLQATVVDLSNVTPHTRRFIAEAGQEERVNVESTDVIAGPPECEMDFAVVRNFIQVISRDDAAKAIKHIGQRVKAGGRLLIRGWVVDDSRITPPSATGVNLFLLNRFDEGEAYTDAEYRQWLGEAGFVDYQRELLDTGMSAVSATKE